MKVLGVDTSSRSLSVAITEGSKVLAEFNGKANLRHSQDLIPTIENLLKSTGLELGDLDGFALSIGPGSFTGLRIGVSTLKGLGIVTGKVIACVPTMDAVVGNLTEDMPNACVIIDAKKNKIYACIYAVEGGNIKRKSEYLLVTVEELLAKIDFPVTFIGDGIARYKDAILSKNKSAQFVEESKWFPKASVVAKLGTERLRKKEGVTSDELVPMYLYSKECSIRGIDK